MYSPSSCFPPPNSRKSSSRDFWTCSMNVVCFLRELIWLCWFASLRMAMSDIPAAYTLHLCVVNLWSFVSSRRAFQAISRCTPPTTWQLVRLYCLAESLPSQQGQQPSEAQSSSRDPDCLKLHSLIWIHRPCQLDGSSIFVVAVEGSPLECQIGLCEAHEAIFLLRVLSALPRIIRV